MLARGWRETEEEANEVPWMQQFWTEEPENICINMWNMSCCINADTWSGKVKLHTVTDDTIIRHAKYKNPTVLNTAEH